jgi:hypothetical protein
VSGNREVERKKREERRTPATKITPPADPRFQSIYNFCYEAYRQRYGQPPTWGGKDQKLLWGVLDASWTEKKNGSGVESPKPLVIN